MNILRNITQNDQIIFLCKSAFQLEVKKLYGHMKMSFYKINILYFTRFSANIFELEAVRIFKRKNAGAALNQ